MKNFYITTTLPYVNAEPHIGFALEIVQADVIARYNRLLGNKIIFNFGTDEHGLKIYRKALEQGKNPQEYCDEYAAKWSKLKEALNLSYTNFIRTTDKHHIEATQEFWKRCLKNGDIIKKNYKTKYCVGCELKKTDSELIDGRCPIHPNLKLEIFEEENYFFRFSKYQQPLLDFYEKNPDFVIPDTKYNEIKTFVRNGLEDFSISRLKSKMPWGIDIPDDQKQVMYVWFDALINYISTLGWPRNQENFDNFWPGIQVAGKDNLRQQTAMWQAMLMSAGLPNSKQVFIHGFITVNEQKISKSLGNVINPFELVKKYGTDPVRYFLLAKINPYEDSDFTIKKFEEAYNADLANGLGNLVARVAKLCETDKMHGIEDYSLDPNLKSKLRLDEYLKQFSFNLALEEIWKELKSLDIKIETDKPWAKSKQERKDNLELYVKKILSLATALQPFLPNTTEKILGQFSNPAIKSQPPLFPRIR